MRVISGEIGHFNILSDNVKAHGDIEFLQSLFNGLEGQIFLLWREFVLELVTLLNEISPQAIDFIKRLRRFAPSGGLVKECSSFSSLYLINALNPTV